MSSKSPSTRAKKSSIVIQAILEPFRKLKAKLRKTKGEKACEGVVVDRPASPVEASQHATETAVIIHPTVSNASKSVRSPAQIDINNIVITDLVTSSYATSGAKVHHSLSSLLMSGPIAVIAKPAAVYEKAKLQHTIRELLMLCSKKDVEHADAIETINNERVAELERLNDEHESVVEKLREDYDAIEEDYETLNNGALALQEQIQAANEEIEVFKGTAEVSRQKMKSMEGFIRVGYQCLVDEQSRCSELRQENQSIEQKLMDWHVEARKWHRVAEEQFNAAEQNRLAKNAADAEMLEFKNKSIFLADDLEQKMQEIRSHERRNETFVTEFQLYQEDHELELNQRDEEIAALKAELESLKETIDEKDTKISSQEAELAAQIERVEAKDEKIASLEGELAMARTAALSTIFHNRQVSNSSQESKASSTSLWSEPMKSYELASAPDSEHGESNKDSTEEISNNASPASSAFEIDSNIFDINTPVDIANPFNAPETSQEEPVSYTGTTFNLPAPTPPASPPTTICNSVRLPTCESVMAHFHGLAQNHTYTPEVPWSEAEQITVTVGDKYCLKTRDLGSNAVECPFT
ncbi:uncharacterized protein HMPREF1541_05194 [Cyphellophora europaea CBS 101466]|uniref:Uncharacterized protein n=1 Tax=Cyphellophora europaea (strain CBS 101466) TaxID=1220924 RepID=W2RZ24_CYPE1|nr:uncharacterized protein HMPREF1541_05194 [Cyphellophora europaea CBS 101466]ETN40914.1 hypothetical protein HMPREF1541_05194 [Cyphellophora europaea CBS 101466]